jgi:Rps23 Pro-64 3,4-dihydroxylase Tpa1-like proline 4-hydroxylase
LNEIASLINRKDIRASKKWCNKNFVTIHSDSSGHFVYKNEFSLAYDMPLINKLKAEHGDSWEIIYEAYKNNTLHKMLDSVPNSKNKVERYVPVGKVALTQIKKHGL